MWYLSQKINQDIKKFSAELLALHGWEDQFSITKKVLHQYSAAVDFFNSENMDGSHKYNIIRAIVDAIYVTWHPINHLKITNQELYNVALNGYEISGKKKEGKIPRTYRKVLEQEYKIPSKNPDMHSELNKMSGLVIGKQIQEYGVTGGLKYQNSIASEEAGELAKELSKYYRGVITNDKNTIDEAREGAVEELFDTLYTMQYIFTSAEIKPNELNDYAKIRVPEIYMREIKYKKR